MRVSEAKNKICPFMSIVGVFEGTQELWEQTCICGDCMAWVVIEDVKLLDTDDMSVGILQGYIEDGWIDDHTDQYYRKPLGDDGTGYCQRLIND